MQKSKFIQSLLVTHVEDTTFEDWEKMQAALGLQRLRQGRRAHPGGRRRRG